MCLLLLVGEVAEEVAGEVVIDLYRRHVAGRLRELFQEDLVSANLLEELHALLQPQSQLQPQGQLLHTVDKVS